LFHVRKNVGASGDDDSFGAETRKQIDRCGECARTMVIEDR